jgi:hypothetical protein
MVNYLLRKNTHRRNPNRQCLFYPRKVAHEPASNAFSFCCVVPDESERLPESEFVMDQSLRQELGAEGEAQVALAKAAAKRAWMEPEVCG